MEKHFTGAVDGRSSTIFVAAFDQERGAGTYVAMKSFEGRPGPRAHTDEHPRTDSEHA